MSSRQPDSTLHERLCSSPADRYSLQAPAIAPLPVLHPDPHPPLFIRSPQSLTIAARREGYCTVRLHFANYTYRYRPGWRARVDHNGPGWRGPADRPAQGSGERGGLLYDLASTSEYDGMGVCRPQVSSAVERRRAEHRRADAYDEVYPHITSLLHPSKSPTSLPITPTILLLLLLPPSLLLPLIPDYLIPYLLLPMGWGPPLAFHPNLSDHISAIPQLAVFRRWQARATRAMLTDALSDELGRATISEVEVWENERLDPAVAGKPTAPGSVPPGSWGQRHLRAGERLPWLKIRNEECIWADEPETGLEQAANGETSKKDKGKIQELKDGWRWIPGEDWRVDMAGTWSAVGVDAGELSSMQRDIRVLVCTEHR